MSCCCFGDNPDEACGYPPKTIRAIISITAVITSFMVFAFMCVYFSLMERFTEAVSIAGIISTELGTIVGYYFGTRNKTEQKQDVEEQRKLLIHELNDHIEV